MPIEELIELQSNIDLNRETIAGSLYRPSNRGPMGEIEQPKASAQAYIEMESSLGNDLG